MLLTFTLIGNCWVSGYDQRIKVTTDHTKVDATLSNFPVTAFFTSTQAEEIFTEFDADEDFDRGQFALGDDTLLYADCELFDDSAQKGIYHFKVTSVSSSAGTDIYFYYDNDHAHNTTYISKSGGTAAQSVWDANFKAVYHMHDALVYDTQYEASVEPDSDDWTLGGTDYASVSAGILTIDTTADNAYTGYYYKAPDIDFNADFYLKTRIKASTSMAADNDYFEIRIYDGTQNEYIKLWIYNGKVIVIHSGGTTTITIDTTTNYVMYEVYIIGTSLKFYMDSVEKYDGTVDTAAVNDNMGFGDYTDQKKAKAEMDYLYYALDVGFNPALVDIFDSTSNNNDGTKKASGEPVEVTGKIGQAQDFDGSDDYIDITSADFQFVNEDVTLEVVTQIPDNTDDYRMFLFLGDVDNDPRIGLAKSRSGADSGKLYFQVRHDPNLGAVYSTETGDQLAKDTPMHLAGVIDHSATELEFFKDGTSQGTDTLVAFDLTTGTPTGVIGAYLSKILVHNDWIDEVRISSAERTAAWLKATYNSLWDSLLTYGSEETSEEDNAILFGTNL